ncbi:hypothetical protein EV421DRAFT_1902592 [Armillaria borealis]|uniref:CBS domain-containing protein n=1 Tax=Armillaria borealis TaxID=47425 RepID=A0AA39JPJ9_9AGAR|nr:hypothetical protein EV421DRAFT_1902592 [Armillaria borealis]
MSSTQVTTTNDKFRGAVVEDLQLPPAFALPSTEVISRAIELAYDRDFSHIPVLDRDRKPLGYLDVAKLKQEWEAGKANPVCLQFVVCIYAILNQRPIEDDRISQYMTKFKRKTTEPYTLITPATPLAELEAFLQDNIFALVTDYQRKFVLGVATSQDLENFVSRRGF